MSLGHLFPTGRAAAIAHRGGSKLRPENTLAAFDHAVALGVDGIECDVHLSRDGVPVVIHDATLDRTTDTTGLVVERTAAELADIDAGSRFDAAAGAPYRGRGVGVPTLAELLDRHPDTPMVVEIKGDDPAVVPAIAGVLRSGRRPDRFLVGGFSQAVLDAVRALTPPYATGASREEVVAAIRRSYFRIRPRAAGYAVFQVPFVFQGKQIFRASFVRTVARAGFDVQAWIIDDEATMKHLMGWGVRGLISDRPDVAVRVVHGGRYNPVA
ncbi:MAG TPA: glycerophosphodiester phosphodiesterase [Vicinamibacterales bacterium]|nr:glycerophosphodiester phosphodiesterase [Vicinamibacterales bacterium]